MLVTRETKIIEANDRAVATYGYSHDELLGMTVRDIRAPETITDIPRQMQR